MEKCVGDRAFSDAKWYETNCGDQDMLIVQTIHGKAGSYGELLATHTGRTFIAE